MKKIFFILLLTIFYSVTYSFAQDSITVYQGLNIQKFLLSEIDSITHNSNNTVNIYHNSQKYGYSVIKVDSISFLQSSHVMRIKGTVILPAGYPDNLEGCKVVSMTSQSELHDGQFTFETSYNGTVQTFIIGDYDNFYMLGRTLAKEEKLIIDARSTALALVTLHPLFVPMTGEDYTQAIEIIQNSEKFEPFLTEVEKTICQKRNLYDETNEALLIAFSNLMEDICSKVDEKDYSDETIDISNTRSSIRRVMYQNPNNYPLYADINGNILTLRNTGLTPSYYGTVSTSDGRTVNYHVLSRHDYGGMDIFRTVGEINLGDPYPFTFTSEGEYRFNLSRTNAAATADFYLRLANCILTGFGLSLGNDAVQELGNTISRAMINAGSGLNDATIDISAWVGIAYRATLEFLRTEFVETSISQSLAYAGRFMLGSLNWYNRVKGGANTAARITYALAAPEELNFCLCYYSGEISTCTEASLTIAGGNDQSGYPKQKLLLPLKVYVQTIGDDGQFHPSSSYHRIKYEVVSGGGSVEDEYVSADNNNVAQTYWTLGESGEQKVKASVVDIITNKEISEPVYFTASMENADITIRLDWHKLSGNTDIDLHVVDPSGEEIYYEHMRSASGGWLDRDDTVGPGPEHVRWTNAPAGTYKIYVVYYHSETGAVTNYTVTVNAGGVSYRPVTGSIGYENKRKVPVGQFTIGENNATARRVYKKQNEKVLTNLIEEVVKYDTGLKK